MRREGWPPDPVIEAYKAGLDRTLLRENLRLTPDQRLRKLVALQRFAAELRAAGERYRRGKRQPCDLEVRRTE